MSFINFMRVFIFVFLRLVLNVIFILYLSFMEEIKYLVVIDKLKYDLLKLKIIFRFD